jgi:hypothetical protein
MAGAVLLMKGDPFFDPFLDRPMSPAELRAFVSSILRDVPRPPERPKQPSKTENLAMQGPPSPHVFDMRMGDAWGHVIYPLDQVAPNRTKVHGCLTPLPRIGSLVRKRTQLWKFVAVTHMGDPCDGFRGTLEIIADDTQGCPVESVLKQYTQGAGAELRSVEVRQELAGESNMQMSTGKETTASMPNVSGYEL